MYTPNFEGLDRTDLWMTNLVNNPPTLDTFTKMSDISASTFSDYLKYNNYMSSGNLVAASELLANNSALKECFFNAEKYNCLRDAVIALENLFLNSITDLYNEVALSAVEVKTMSTTIQSESWQQNETYYVTNIVVDGLTNDSIVDITLPDNITDPQYDAWLEGVISTGNVGTDGFTLKARGVKPTVDIPIIVTYRELTV